MARGQPKKNGSTGNNAVVRKSWVGRIPPEVPVFLFYLAATLFLTWPLVTRFATSIYGVPADNLGAIWVDWWSREAGSFGATASFCPIVGFPFGAELGTVPLEPLSYVIRRFLLVFTSEIVAYNVETMAGFFLSGVTMYYLVRYLTGDRRAAFFGGFAYLLMPYHAYLSMFMGGGIAAVQWMPLYVLLLLKFTKQPTGKNTVLLAGGALLVAGVSLHYGMFMAIFTAAFLAGRYLARAVAVRGKGRRKGLKQEGTLRPRVNRKTLALSLMVVLVVVAAVSPFFYVSVINSAPPGKWPTVPTPSQLRISKYTVWSGAAPGDYTSIGRSNHIYKRVTGRDPWASGMNSHGSLYIGWVVIALAAVSLMFAARGGGGSRLLMWKRLGKRGRQPEPPYPGNGASVTGRFNIWGFAAAALTCFVLSLPPHVNAGSVEIPLPSALFRIVAPWFRWYLRLGVVVELCFMVIACFGLAWVLGRVRKPIIRGGVLVLLTVVLAVELLIVPPFENYDCDTVPQAFEQVAGFPEGTAIAVYPLVENGSFFTSTVKFYQRHFRQPMLNGAPDNSDGEALRRTVYNPYSEATPGILRAFGIERVVFFRKWYEEHRKENPSLHFPAGLEAVASSSGNERMGEAYLLEVAAPPAEVFPLYLGDISIPVLESGAVTARLVASDGRILLVNYGGRDIRTTLSLPVKNPFSPRRVTIKKGEDTLWSGDLEAGVEMVIKMEGVTIPSEGAELQVMVEGYVHRLNDRDLTHFGTEVASLRIGDLEIDVVE